MAEEKLISSLGIYDYDRNKLCDLYDSQNHLAGQAYNIQWVKNYNGIPTLTFVIPYKVENKVNYRWKYMRSEYLIRITRGNKTEWFIASKPVKSKSREITGTVTCNGFGAILKTKNIYLEFDDENGIGTIQYLMGQILKGTGWTLGHYDTLYEADGTTEKVRSLKSGNKQGALGLITTVCNLFKCYPIYDSENMQVNIYSVNNRSKVMELEVGRNAESVSVNENSDDIVTRLYVEGEYSEYGYVGIDDVNPTGLNFLLNFDYYKEIGVFTQTHQTAVDTYLTNIKDVKDRISANETIIINKETEINNRIGQCIMSLYYVSDGFTNPKYTYGNPTDAQKQLKKGDEVYVLKNDWTYRVVKITTTAAALIQTGDYGIAKFATKSAGSIGAKEVQVEAKQKQISNLQKKISATTKADKIAEYNHEISELQAQITDIYENENGLYQQMYEVMSQSGYLKDLNYYEAIRTTLLAEQDDIEATFISAMGNMLRDGYWQNNNYISGQEESLYADAVEMSEQLGKPKATYTVNYIRAPENNDIPIDDIEINQIARLLDEDIEVYENLFVTKVTIGIDNEKQGSIEVSNEDIALSANDLGSLLSRMSQLADLIEQKNALYERAKAITASGGIYAERLNGQINVLKNQLLSTVSNWYTDDQGNIMFESADGGSAMMLCGAGFMIASEKDNDGNFIWRTYGTGHGFTADEIVAGFISAERIEAGSIATSKLQADVGNTLVITGNPAITQINNQIAPEFNANTSYKTGDLVMHNGVVYMFTQNHTGAWNSNHVVSTNLSAQIELLPDKIIQYVGEKGYSRTFVQLTDPALDPDNMVVPGDYWVKSDTLASVWENPNSSNVKWNDFNNHTWGSMMTSMADMYCRKGTGANAEWVPVNDINYITEAYTRIEQTRDQITQEAYRANAAEGQLDTKINQTAHDIMLTAERSYIAQTNAYDSVNKIIDEAISLANDAATSAKNASIAKTAMYQSADAIVTAAVATAGENADDSYVAKTTTYQTADQIVSAAQTYTNDKLTNYSTRAQTSTMISGYVTDNAYGKVSGIEITADGIEVSGSKYVRIKSGGTFTVDSGNFSISTTGKVAIAPGGGTISTWTIGQQSFYNYVEDSSTHIRSHYVGLGTGTYAIWAGAAATAASTTPSAGNSPFWVKTTGEMKATLGTVGGWTIGTNYIGNAGTRGDSTVGMAIVSSDSSMAFWAGGAFTGGTPAFSVTKGGALKSTNADIAGKVTATSGAIGGWNLTANRIASGSGTGYVAMDSNTSNTYAIWAGNSTAGSAPFRVQRDGTVYLTKLKMVKETSDGTSTEDVNFSSNDNRLRGATVLGWTVSGSTLTISTTYGQINFNKATSLSGTWSGGGMLNITASGTSTSLASVAIGNKNPVWGTGADKYKATIDITDNGSFVNYSTAVIRTITVDAEDVWKQGWNDAVDSGRQVTYYNLGDTSHANQELFYKSGSSYISIGTGWTKPTTVNLVLVPQKKT